MHGHADETPLTTIHLHEYEIGRAPVTNSEYAAFVDDGGYTDARWWQGDISTAWWQGQLRDEGNIAWWQVRHAALREDFDAAIATYYSTYSAAQIAALHTYAGWSATRMARWLERRFAPRKYRRPAHWSDPRFCAPAKPVVGVSLYEALAYSRWLSAQTREHITLPLEEQWEAAARGLSDPGTEARLWPWGDSAPQPGECNINGALGRTSYVGSCPGADTPEGATDMCGNALEWTLSSYPQHWHERRHSQRQLSATGDLVGPHILRGGAWQLPPHDCRPAYRCKGYPGNRVNIAGLRLIRLSLC